MSEEARNIILYGTNGHEVKVYYKGQRGEGVYDVAFEGLIRNVQRRYREVGSESVKEEYESFMTITPCDVCEGQRLKQESLAVTVAGKNIYEITTMSIDKLADFLENMELTDRQQFIGGGILKEIKARLKFLMDVGLNYLALYRATGTLSGGAGHRIPVPEAAFAAATRRKGLAFDLLCA